MKTLSRSFGIAISQQLPPEIRIPQNVSSFTNSEGVWSFSGYTILLNGVPTVPGGSGTELLLIGDTVFALGTDDFWYQWMYLSSGVQGQVSVKGYKRLERTEDPTIYVLPPRRVTRLILTPWGPRVQLQRQQSVAGNTLLPVLRCNLLIPSPTFTPNNDYVVRRVHESHY